MRSLDPTYASDLPGLVASSPANACRRLERMTIAASAPGSHTEGGPVHHSRSASSTRASRDRSCRRFKFPGLQRVQRSLEDHAGCPLDLSGRGTRCLVAASTRTACRHSKRAQIWRSMAARKAEMCLLEQPLQQTHDEMLFVKLQVEARSMPRTIRMYIPWVQSNIASTLRRMSVVAYSSPYLLSLIHISEPTRPY